MSVKSRISIDPEALLTAPGMRDVVLSALGAAHARTRLRIHVEDCPRPCSPVWEAHLRRILNWMDIVRNEDIFFQSRNAEHYRIAAARLITGNRAYCSEPDQNGRRPVRFLIPIPDDNSRCLRDAGFARIRLNPESTVVISSHGVRYCREGETKRLESTLASMASLVLHDSRERPFFRLKGHLEEVLAGRVIRIRNASSLVFPRKEVFFHDPIHGTVAVPLDRFADPVIVRSDGTPCGHLTNVLDDIDG
ncbi:MAG: hypothetical protein J6R85_03025, partial [Lentisphaeria bacterium]|nr:hypothetical protein [Lentisphaeria bacterium]